MHNLAELLLVMGKQKEATDLQEKIIQLVEHPTTATSTTTTTAAAPRSNSTTTPPMVAVATANIHSKTAPTATASDTTGLGPDGSDKGVSNETIATVTTEREHILTQPSSSPTRRKIEKNVLPPQVTYTTRPKKKQ